MTPLLDNRTISLKAQLIQHPAAPVLRSRSFSKTLAGPNPRQPVAISHQPMCEETLLSVVIVERRSGCRRLGLMHDDLPCVRFPVIQHLSEPHSHPGTIVGPLTRLMNHIICLWQQWRHTEQSLGQSSEFYTLLYIILGYGTTSDKLKKVTAGSRGGHVPQCAIAGDANSSVCECWWKYSNMN